MKVLVEELLSCPVCDASRSVIFRVVFDEASADSVSRRIVECCDCGMIYLKDRVPQSELHRFYPADYISYQLRPVDAPQGFRDKLFNYSLRKMQTERMEAIERFVERSTHSTEMKLGPQSRLLDLGCGSGFFLAMARQRWDCKVVGVDFSKDNVEYARNRWGLPVQCGEVANHDGLDGTFDLVTLNHFIEHEYDPRSTLGLAHRQLQEDGLLVLYEVPNIRSLSSRLFGQKWFHNENPRHTLFFTPKTITFLLKRCGFEVESIYYPLQPIAWSGSIQKLLGMDFWKNLRKSILPATLLYLLCVPLCFFANAVGRGDDFVVFARKQPSA